MSWEGLLPGSSSLVAKCIPVFIKVRISIVQLRVPTYNHDSFVLHCCFEPSLVITSQLEQAPDWLTRREYPPKFRFFNSHDSCITLHSRLVWTHFNGPSPSLKTHTIKLNLVTTLITTVKTKLQMPETNIVQKICILPAYFWSTFMNDCCKRVEWFPRSKQLPGFVPGGEISFRQAGYPLVWIFSNLHSYHKCPFILTKNVWWYDKISNS